MLIYGVLFGTGKLLLHETGMGVAAAGDGHRGRAQSSIAIFRGGVECGCRLAWPCSALVLGHVCASAGPVDFGMAELNAAMAARKFKCEKIMAELNLDPPETFRIEPYAAGARTSPAATCAG